MKKQITEKMMAPDFELVDTHGHTIRLSDYRGRQHVVLVLNRGFV
jgi:peroxiredoxin